jgi:hypothetical protein
MSVLFFRLCNSQYLPLFVAQFSMSDRLPGYAAVPTASMTKDTRSGKVLGV